MVQKIQFVFLVIIIFNYCETAQIISKLKNEPFIGASSSILVNLLDISAKSKHLLNQTCSEQLNELSNGIQQKNQWAIKALDSSARIQAEFFYGNNYWLGSPVECASLNKPFHITLNNRFHRIMKADLLNTTAPYDIGYRIIHARHNSPWQIEIEFLITEKILYIGLCVPSSCTDEEIGVLTQKYIDTHLESSLESRPVIETVKDLKVKTNFSEKLSVKILGCIIGFTLIMVSLAAIIDREPQNICETFIMCYSVRKNWKTFTIEKNNELTDQFYVINGLKGVGSLIVMVFHTCIFSHFITDNPVVMFGKQESNELPFVLVTPYIVDLFFTMSSFLLVYTFLNNTKKNQLIKENNLINNFKLLGKHVLSRYIRLSPLYFIIMLITEIAVTYLRETTPFYYSDKYDEMCREHWLRHLLFIQVFYNSSELCGKWLWSVACDVQYFALTSIVLFIYTKNQRLAKIITVTIFVVIFTVVFYIGMHTKFLLSHDVLYDLGDELYMRPWARIFPYIVGSYFAWYFTEKKSKLNFGRITSGIFWILSAVIMLGSHFGWAYRDTSVFTATASATVYRCLYSASVCWIIIATVSDGYGSWLSKILNMSWLQQFRSICFSFYMINPLIIKISSSLIDRPQHFNQVSLTILAIGMTTIIYCLSFLSSLLFELPYNNCVLTILNRQKVKIN